MDSVKCPHCGAEMEQGWSYVRMQSLAWYKTEKPPIEEEIFPEQIHPNGRTMHRKNPSLRCRSCRIVVIQFPPDGEWV